MKTIAHHTHELLHAISRVEGISLREAFDRAAPGMTPEGLEAAADLFGFEVEEDTSENDVLRDWLDAGTDAVEFAPDLYARLGWWLSPVTTRNLELLR